MYNWIHIFSRHSIVANNFKRNGILMTQLVQKTPAQDSEQANILSALSIVKDKDHQNSVKLTRKYAILGISCGKGIIMIAITIPKPKDTQPSQHNHNCIKPKSLSQGTFNQV